MEEFDEFPFDREDGDDPKSPYMEYPRPYGYGGQLP